MQFCNARSKAALIPTVDASTLLNPRKLSTLAAASVVFRESSGFTLSFLYAIMCVYVYKSASARERWGPGCKKWTLQIKLNISAVRAGGECVCGGRHQNNTHSLLPGIKHQPGSLLHCKYFCLFCSGRVGNAADIKMAASGRINSHAAGRQARGRANQSV